MRHVSKRSGFTLVELLVVVTVITILAAMLLPALKSAIESARTIVCMNNQKQLGVYFQFYTDEYGVYPAASGDTTFQYSPEGVYISQWMSMFAKANFVPDSRFLYNSEHSSFQTKMSLRCPNQPSSGQSTNPATCFALPFGFSESTRCAGGKRIGGVAASPSGWAITWTKPVHVTNPSRTLLLIEALAEKRGWTQYGTRNKWCVSSNGAKYTPRHTGNNNFLWCDGHVETEDETWFENMKQSSGTWYKYAATRK